MVMSIYMAFPSGERYKTKVTLHLALDLPHSSSTLVHEAAQAHHYHQVISGRLGDSLH